MTPFHSTHFNYLNSIYGYAFSFVYMLIQRAFFDSLFPSKRKLECIDFMLYISRTLLGSKQAFILYLLIMKKCSVSCHFPNLSYILFTYLKTSSFMLFPYFFLLSISLIQGASPCLDTLTILNF